jgi:hypothetical protein
MIKFIIGKDLIMEGPQIPHDDFMDVMEMTNKMESYINHVLKDNDSNLAVSALIGACINCMLSQCSTLTEVMFYRNLFVQILDNSIRNIRIQGPQKPPSF